MNIHLFSKYPASSRSRCGFSLIEVVLAIGIFLVTVLALVGLLGPTLQSVDEVEKTDEIASVVNTVNAFLQNSPAIATPSDSKFETIFEAVASDGFATIFVFRSFRDATSNDIVLKIGFYGENVGDPAAEITDADFSSGNNVLSAGTIYRVILSPSSVTPVDYLVGDPPVRNAEGVFQLVSPSVDNYLEGYFAMEVRIYAEDGGPAYSAALPDGLADLAGLEPMFTYNTAVVR